LRLSHHGRHQLVLVLREAIARVGWTETARRCGIDRVTLHRAFGTTPKVKGPRGPIGPSLDTVLAVLPAVGIELSISWTAGVGEAGRSAE
jgi:DNA-binding phage protein